MVHLLEAHGVRVYSLAIDAAEVDARVEAGQTLRFSQYPEICRTCPLDAGHELAHLALHRHAAPHGRQAEQDATPSPPRF